MVWLAIPSPLRAIVASTSRALRLRASTTICGASAASAATVRSVAANPCSTWSGSHGLSSSRSPMQ